MSIQTFFFLLASQDNKATSVVHEEHFYSRLCGLIDLIYASLPSKSSWQLMIKETNELKGQQE